MTVFKTIITTDVEAAQDALTAYGESQGLYVSSFQVTDNSVIGKFETILLVNDYNGGDPGAYDA